MEQLYLIEIFIDKVNIVANDENEKSANKSILVKVKFGPDVHFIIREAQSPKGKAVIQKDDVIEHDEKGNRKWCRNMRVGKSYLFPSCSDTVFLTLEKFPLEIEVWNDDENEKEIFVGAGTMHWDTQFFHLLKETANAKSPNTALSIKKVTSLTAECCCKKVGEVSFILRLDVLGDSISTDFEQLMSDPESFLFRTNKAPSQFSCKRVDINGKMYGNLYETTILEDQEIQKKLERKIEVCTEMQSCGNTASGSAAVCDKSKEEIELPSKKQKYPIKQIRMGDINGPCGNSDCPLAHKVRAYIRNLDTYKQEAAGKVAGNKINNGTKKVCGSCICKDDRSHLEDSPAISKSKGPKATCAGCGGVVPAGDTCEDRKKKAVEGSTPVAYIFSVHKVPGYKESMFGRNFIEENLDKDLATASSFKSQPVPRKPGACGCRRPFVALSNFSHVSSDPKSCPTLPIQSLRSIGSNSAVIYNVEVTKESTSKGNQSSNYQQCAEISDDKDCKCAPTIPTPPCRTFDCDCLTELKNIAARKAHKTYCPLYKHKNNCPVMMHEEEPCEDDEDITEPLPYGLPPIQLGPCPVMGRPCSVPDGFAKMYKNAHVPTLPPSYDNAGKVCCSKEYERIKKALKDYQTYEKENDFRCVNRFNVDNERRCCDKEQKLHALLGKGCCGAHKMAIQEKFKTDAKK